VEREEGEAGQMRAMAGSKQDRVCKMNREARIVTILRKKTAGVRQTNGQYWCSLPPSLPPSLTSQGCQCPPPQEV